MGACACDAYAYLEVVYVSMSKNPLSFSTMQRYDIYKSTSGVFRRSQHILVNNGKKKRLPPEDESLCIILPLIFPSPE